MAAPALAAERWRPRTVERLGLWSAGAVTLKAYAILADPSRRPEPALLAAARRTAEGTADAVAGTPHRGAGFAILHCEAGESWLPVHWWLDGGTLAGRSFRRAARARAFLPLDPPTSCVWELALIDHERRAWIRTGMAPSADISRYFDDVLRQDFC